MKYKSLLIHRVSILVIIVLFLNCESTQKKNDLADPFPSEILNHKTFKIFRSDNRLGYTFRNINKQVIGEKFWGGQKTSSRGEDRVVNYTRQQSAALRKRFPGIGFIKFKGAFNDTRGFRVILKGLKIHELKKSFLQPEFKNYPQIKNREYIISTISADKVIIQVIDQTGVKRKTSLLGIFSGDFEYSQKHNGAITAKNVFIGYILTKPSKHDLERKPFNREIIKLAVFKPDDSTNDSRLNWIPHSIKNKLEEAFQKLPKFYVITDNKNDARFHLKGSIKKIGPNIEFDLTLYDSHRDNRILHKQTQHINIKNLDKLYDYQYDIVKNFTKPFGINFSKGEESLLKKAGLVILSKKDIELNKIYKKALNFYKNNEYNRTETLLKSILNNKTNHYNAIILFVQTLNKLKKHEAALDYAFSLSVLAEKNNDILLLKTALTLTGDTLVYRKEYNSAIKNYNKGLNVIIKLLGAKHPETVKYNKNLGLAYFFAKKYHKALYYYNKDIEILKNTYGQKSKEVGERYFYMGAAYSNLKDYVNALDYLFHSMKISIRNYGYDHKQTANIYAWVGKTYYMLKNFNFAEKYYLKTLKINEKEYGMSHANTVKAYWWLASIYKNMGYMSNYNYYMGKYNFNKK